MPSSPLNSPLTLVVPFHNEERHLPLLLASLRAQQRHEVPVVFVDNGSRDGSRALVEQTPEVTQSRWHCIEETRIGKFHAMKTGTRFSIDHAGANWIGFVDADSYFATTDWLATSAAITAQAGLDVGYVYSPIRYVGTESLPVFCKACAAYDSVLSRLVTEVGWPANGQGFLAAADILERYFAEAHVTTEIDLRLSLLSLHEGRSGILNSGLVHVSARRTLVNQDNFLAWCFYDSRFYTAKDINSPIKLDLDPSGDVSDLRPDQIEQFFARRARKIVVRHLMPLAIFDRTGRTSTRLTDTTGVEVSTETLDAFSRFRRADSYLLGRGFEDLVDAIESHPISTTLAGHLAARMKKQFNLSEGERKGAPR